MWQRIKSFFKPSKIPDVDWVADEDNQWDVPVVDVRPVTLGLISTTSSPQYAANSGSWSGEDGTVFIGVNPRVTHRIKADLRYAIDSVFVDGVLFTPGVMEHKWVIFHHQKRIICVRSWTREVEIVAETEIEGEHLKIAAIIGDFSTQDEGPEFTIRMLDFLIRSHAMRIVHPVPVPAEIDDDPNAMAMFCFSLFGNMAHFATPHSLATDVPNELLRTISLLHIAVAKRNMDEVRRYIRARVPPDILGNDGLSPLHWAMAQEDNEQMAELLLELGATVDVKSAEGATPLMNAAQTRSLENTRLLLDNGADADAKDERGFTSLHRAAEMGEQEIVQLLLERGASPHSDAEGHTPRSLAEGRGDTAIMELLGRAQGDV